MILSAQSIRWRCRPEIQQAACALITPFSERAVDPVTGMSHGLSSCGYDVRLDAGMRYPNEDCRYGTHGVPPLGERNARFAYVQDGATRVSLATEDQMVIPPGSFVLAATMERFDLPSNLAMVVRDKSSWARRGIFLQNTVAEPGWRGHLTLEISNDSRVPVVVAPGCPIAQVMFELLDEPTQQPYPERGKYQDQGRGPQDSRREG